MFPPRTAWLMLLILCLLPGKARAQNTPAELLEGSLAAAVDQLGAQVKANPDDDQRRFALGIAQALHGVEKLAAKLYDHGLQTGGLGQLPMFRLPIPENPSPKETTVADLDGMIAGFLADLETARETLKHVDDPNLKLPVRVGMIRIDLNGPAPGGETPLWELGTFIGLQVGQKQAEQYTIHFDLGDAKWLEGYTHLLAALGEMYLAYDKHELFDVTGHIMFARPVCASSFLGEAPPLAQVGGVDVVDMVAFLHMLRLPVKDAAKMEFARQHLLGMITCSRESWDLILAETDDDREWLPNPRQTNIVTQMTINENVINTWRGVLADFEEVLEGRKLIPFWRQKGGEGINVTRVFTEPRTFDLVLWIQGTAAVPYLEQGDMATAINLRTLNQLLGGNAFGFAMWAN